MDTAVPEIALPRNVTRALILVDDGVDGGVKAAAAACGVARSTLTRWRKRRSEEEAVRQAFLAAKSDIRAEQRQQRVDRVLDHLCQGGGMLDLAEELGVSRSTLYLDLKEMGGFEKMAELRDQLAKANGLQVQALQSISTAILAGLGGEALLESSPLGRLLTNPATPATVRAAALGVLQKLASQSAGAGASVSVTNNVVAAAQAGTAPTAEGPPKVNLDGLDDAQLHDLADKLIELEAVG